MAERVGRSLVRLLLPLANGRIVVRLPIPAVIGMDPIMRIEPDHDREKPNCRQTQGKKSVKHGGVNSAGSESNLAP